MRVKCEICGNNVDTGAGNYIFANGIHQHKKCPHKSKLSPEEIKDRKELTDAIQWVSIKWDASLNWPLITKQIKVLLEKGYNYQDQLYALKWLVNKDDKFWGYGRVEKFIEHAMHYKEQENKLKETQQKQVSNVEEKHTGDLRDKIFQSSKPELFI